MEQLGLQKMTSTNQFDLPSLVRRWTVIGLFWIWLSVLGHPCMAQTVPATQSSAADFVRPNIVLILADDLGYTDLACYGSGFYETPNIDRLAKEGMRWLNHHHCQNCTPTRAALLSGQHPARTGVYTVGGIDRFDWSMRPLQPVENVIHLPLDRMLVGESLQQAGYATAMFGKWHIGQAGQFHPRSRGFLEAVIAEGRHFRFETNPSTELPDSTYLADYLTDLSVDFIDRHHDQPFFLYLPHFGVHTPLQAKEELIAKYRDKTPVGGHRNPVYAAMIDSIDRSVGRVLESLETHHLTERTLVIFASDNGGIGGYQREGLDQKEYITDNAPLRHGKGSLYEGGIRVPLITRWPSIIPAGTTCNEPTLHVDLYPTMLELTDAPPPPQQLDGLSLKPLFNDPAAMLPRDAIFHHFPGYLGQGKNRWRTTPVSVVQMRQWKLLEFLEDGQLELYDLETDLSESRNLASMEPQRAAMMRGRLEDWRREVNASMPKPNLAGVGK
jgi:arylsulfatase A-like enzyme